MAETRIQVRGDDTDHTCWEGSPEEFKKLREFTCEECCAEFFPGDSSLGTTHLFEYVRQAAVSEDEREHCERVAQGYVEPVMPYQWWEDDCRLVGGELRDLLLRERASARAEGEAKGYERGRAEGYHDAMCERAGDSLRIAELEEDVARHVADSVAIVGVREKLATEQEHRRIVCEDRNKWFARCQALQAKYERLCTAARAAWDAYVQGTRSRRFVSAMKQLCTLTADATLAEAEPQTRDE